MNKTFTWETGGNHQFHPLKNGCCLGFQLHHQIQHGYTPEGLTWLHMRIRYSWKFPEKPTEIGLGLANHHGFRCFQSFNVGGVFQPENFITTDPRRGAASRNRCLAGEVMYLPASPSRKNRFPPEFRGGEIPIGGWGGKGIRDTGWMATRNPPVNSPVEVSW